MREVLSRFATGVTVITAMIDGRPHGMTANAFMSGSLDPALVLISVARGARTHAAIESEGAFGVSILGAKQAATAACFAGRDVPFDGAFEFQDSVPIVAGSLGWLVARLSDSHQVGDHTVFVGEVQDLGITGEGANSPLAYYAGAFCSVSRPDPAPVLHGWYAELWG